MVEQVAVQILMKAPYVKELLEKGYVEIVSRKGKGKILKMPKCDFSILDSKGEKQQTQELKTFIHKLFDKSDISDVRKMVKRTFKTGKNIENKIHEMSVNVSEIFSTTKAVKSLSYLNAGIGVANLAVDIAGFVVIANMINSLGAEVQEILSGVTNIENNLKNEIISDCNKLIMDYNRISDAISNNSDGRICDTMEQWLSNINSFFLKLYNNLKDKALSTELVLKMMFSLLPAYNAMLIEFVTRYYYQYGKKPMNYDMLLNTYDALVDDDFKTKLQDYYFLEEKMNYTEMLDVIGAHVLLAVNGRTMVEDQMALLEALKTKENMEEFDRELEEVVKQEYQAATAAASV